jgi:carboxyl-terminal processing protease
VKTTLLRLLIATVLAGCATASRPVVDPNVQRFAVALAERVPGRSAAAQKKDRVLFWHALARAVKHSLYPVDATTLTNAAIAGIGAPVVYTGLTPGSPVDGAIRAMVASFDDRGAWLEVLDRDESASIGLQLGILEENVYVVEVSPGGPAEKAGVRPFDRVLAIDGRQTASLEPEQIVDSLYGAPGSSSTISIARGASGEPRLVTMVRTPTRDRTVRVERLPGNIAYARILYFGRATKWDLETELNRVGTESPLKGLVLDLRFNAGGEHESAFGVANLFLGSGVIAKYAGRDAAAAPIEKSADAWRDHPALPTIVITNGKTAGAAELVTAALVDNGYARSLGTRTFGSEKGQITWILSETRALQLTTHRVLTPKGVPLSAGLTPGVEMKEADRPMDVECFQDPVVLRAASELGR